MSLFSWGATLRWFYVQTFILLVYYEYKNEIHLYTEVSLPSTLSPTKQVRQCIVVNNRGSLLYTKHQFVTLLAVFRCLMGHLHQLDYSGNRNFSKAWSLKQLAINTYMACTDFQKVTNAHVNANPPRKLCIFCCDQPFWLQICQSPKFTPCNYLILCSIAAALILFHVIHNCHSNQLLFFAIYTVHATWQYYFK